MLRVLTSALALLVLGAAAPVNAAEAAAQAGSPAPGKRASHAARLKSTSELGAPQVAVLKTVQGTIVIKLSDSDAPKTCANFRKLVRQHFYDSTYFHRVIPGFMIQGGDPNTKSNDNPFDDGQGGPGYTIPAEIKLKHLRGSVATARLGDEVNPKRESSGSQFFICLTPQPGLDGGYTVFGEVISGMEVADKIAALARLPGIAKTQAGPDPQKQALVTRAWLEPLSQWQKPAAAPVAPAATPSEAPAAAPPDTTRH